MSLFPSTIIENWEYQNEEPLKQESVLNKSHVGEIKDDDVDILFRIINQNQKLSKQKVEAQKVKKNVDKNPDKIQFVPAPIHKMSLKELKDHLKALGLSTEGTKADLIRRYENFGRK